MKTGASWRKRGRIAETPWKKAKDMVVPYPRLWIEKYVV